MKKLLLLLFFVPTLASANIFMGTCKEQYGIAYKVMIARQSNVPMYAPMEGIDKIEAENSDLKNNKDFRAAMEEYRSLLEKAYRMPSLGFMESAAHTMATEFANRHYLRCTRGFK